MLRRGRPDTNPQDEKTWLPQQKSDRDGKTRRELAQGMDTTDVRAGDGTGHGTGRRGVRLSAIMIEARAGAVVKARRSCP